MDLFSTHGYDEVTITQIAERAGITRRSYFRYFPDKREVLFARSEQLPPVMAEAVRAVEAEADPLSAALRAIRETGALLVTRIERTAERRAVISASAELRERERTKLAAVTAVLGEALQDRGASPAEAELVARIAGLVFENAFARWIDAGGRDSFAVCVDEVTTTFREVVAGMPDE